MKNIDERPSDVEEISICRHCKEQIKRGSSKCYHCGDYQNRFRNSLPAISLVMVVIAITQISLLFIQHQSAKEKVKQAVADAEIISNIKKQIEHQQKKITELEEAFEKATIQAAQALPKKQHSKLTYSSRSIQKTAAGIEVIINFETFVELYLGKVEFSIEIEDKTNAKILSIDPAEPIAFYVASTIEKNRRKGHLSYVTSGSSPPKIKVTLSAPAKLIIQGKPDLELFELDIK